MTVADFYRCAPDAPYPRTDVQNDTVLIAFTSPTNRYFFELTSRPWIDDGQRIWRGAESRMDELGRTWTRQIARAVVDDFGNLVEVAP